MSDPLVSVITRTRERPRFLQRAAESVMGQEAPPAFEWILVNDGGEREPVEAMRAELPEAKRARIRMRHLPASRGMEHASNVGVELSGGRYLVIHDDDDTWDPCFLRDMTAFMEEPQHRSLGGVVCHSLRVVERTGGSGGGFVEEERHPFNDWLEELDFFRVLMENPFPPISFLFRRSLYQRTGPFREDLPVLGDWEFNLRALARGRIGILPRLLARYHHRPPEITGPEANSITAGDQRHRETERRLREEWTRDNPFGIDPELFARAARIAGSLKEMRKGMEAMEKKAGTLGEAVPPQY